MARKKVYLQEEEKDRYYIARLQNPGQPRPPRLEVVTPEEQEQHIQSRTPLGRQLEEIRRRGRKILEERQPGRRVI